MSTPNERVPPIPIDRSQRDSLEGRVLHHPRVALRALDPAMVDGLSQTQRDVLADAIVAVWQGACPSLDDGLSESAVYLRVPTAQR